MMTEPLSIEIMPPRHLFQTIFSSLTRSTLTSASISTPTPPPTTWTLLRTLKSENPNDLQGILHGTATFTPLSASQTENNGTDTSGEGHTDLLYSESGSLPASFGPGLRWTKKYIWRLSANGRISVWFVKADKKSTPDGEEEEEADYLFHEFDFAVIPSPDSNSADFVTPPTPPEVQGLARGSATKVITARGNHLCIDDMYRTAYAFRVDESGEVLSWASRHVVRGPRKGQDIVNLYSRGL
ncbi:hypothetical protein BDW75DRAFT_91791 [Aspergillus navahoensis]